MTSPSYETRRVKGAKRMRIIIRGDGHVLITRPWWVSKRRADRFFRRHKQWVSQKLSQFHDQTANVDIYIRDTGHYTQHKEKARSVIQRKVTYWNSHYGFTYNRIAIRNQRTRWGSCSGHRNLNFSYKILFLPEYLQDYIIVHELCHLKELNHSPRFWQLVAETIPDYKNARRELKKY